MSVLIKDMEMPETCDDCPFHVYHSHYEYVCKATPMFYPLNLANTKGIRKKWCPLSEVSSTQQEGCDDVVSRKAVEHMLQNGFPARGMWEIEGDVVKQTVCETLADALMDLEKLPSAQSEPSTEIQEILEYLDSTLHPIVSPDNWNVYAELHDMVSKLPSAQPQRTGHWIEDDDEMFVICSECGEKNDYISAFCPDCGAKMINARGEQNE